MPRAINSAKFPRRLQEARGDLTMSEAATVCGLGSRQHWHKYEAGQNVPRIDTVERLAAALGVSPAWLAGWEERT